MTWVHDQVVSLGGVARTADLNRRGIGPSLIESAWRSGDIVRVRKGWYASPRMSPEVIQAVRVGGALACVSAARHHGLWTPGDDTCLHIAVPLTAARLRSPRAARESLARASRPVAVHWKRASAPAVQSVPESIALAIRCQGAETGFVLLESALHLRLLSRGERTLLNVTAPDSFRLLAMHAGSTSESGTESIVKLLLLDLALPFRQQVKISGVGRVDFVLGNRLVVEVDSREFHSDPLADRQRDAALSARGFRCLRFMYAQVVHDLDAVRGAILGAVVRGDLSA